MTPARSLVEDVRRFGLASADFVVDRYVRLADDALGSDRAAASPPRPPGPAGTSGPGPDVAGLADGTGVLAVTWLRLLEATASMADLVSGAGASVTTLELAPTAAGLTAEASLWVHNTTASAAPVELAATTLAGPPGQAVAADAVRFEPARLDPLAARTGAEIRLRVHVPGGQPPGRYQGLVLASAADRPVLLRLDVTPSEGAGS